MSVELLYIHDPMCSWCWGFRPCYQHLKQLLPADISIKRLVGGLAPDSAEPMPQATRQMVMDNWKRIQQKIPGTRFNYDFWTRCEPRRSTYPACRAVIAARGQGAEYDEAMTLAIQQAYYLHAQNPSDDAVLMACADSIGLDTVAFEQEYFSASCAQRLREEIAWCRSIGADSFPSLALQAGSSRWWIDLNYTDARAMHAQICELLGPGANDEE